MSSGTENADAFINRWSKAEASERANAQLFLSELTDLLRVPRPANSHADGYSFEFPVKIPLGPGTETEGRIDLYRRGSFVLEAKQFIAPKAEQTDLQLAVRNSGVDTAIRRTASPIRGTVGWDDAMWRAKGQAERYVRHLPPEEPTAPFLLVVDVGHSIEVFADFTQAGRAYQPYPDPRTFRIRLADLGNEAIRERLRLIWQDPLSLDPAKVSAEVTREIAGYLATLAASLEQAGHAPRLVAEFLTRCLFCMFAEDVGLLEKDSFYNLLESLRKSPEGFVPMLKQLFSEMQTGTQFSVVLNKKLLRFNGGLFEEASVLPVNGMQLGILILAAAQQWKNVEPAIFGTLLERALDPEERHQLGAHYTPRAYVERLVLPTVIEPLRAEWGAVRAAALVHAQKGELKKSRAEVNAFHDRLCSVTVLDPACGSGNFLYVALQHLKLLEGEVLDTAAQFGENFKLELETHTIDPHQFLGIELNPRAASIAELVLWIGYLQWHFKIHGERTPPEPILRAFNNIECRDAVLGWDGEPQPVRDVAGNVVTVWDRSMKPDFLTGRQVPDETKRAPLVSYPNGRPATWPKADYILGNPPFIGDKRMREDLNDGYVEVLRAVYPEVPESADFVMYWWHKAAHLVRAGKAKRFGLIATNSLRQPFNRRVTQQHLGELSLVFAIPDHPWVDPTEHDEKKANVRIAMAVAELGAIDGELHTVQTEVALDDGSANVTFAVTKGRIAADLTIGTNLLGMDQLTANSGLNSNGMMLAGSGFIVTPDEAKTLGLGEIDDLEKVMRPYRNGRDLTGTPRGAFVLDLYGLEVDEIRTRFPTLYQHLLTNVKPERDANRRPKMRDNWWIFGEPRKGFRAATKGLRRYIATVETSKHRFFVFLPTEILPDHKLNVFALDDAFFLGVLSSRIHTAFALATGSTLEDRPVYLQSRGFLPFPFPACNEAAKVRIRDVAEELDAHRKRVQAKHPGLSLTAMYNILEALRAGRALTSKEQATHDASLISILHQLHNELDAAVAAAYAWPVDLSEPEILTRLVALNSERSAEEDRGQIRWLRPAYQAPAGARTQGGLVMATKETKSKKKVSKAKEPWPKSLAERVQAVERALELSATPVTPSILAQHFFRAKPEDLAEILETLVTLGRAYLHGETYSH
jgi:hypothetical protein